MKFIKKFIKLVLKKINFQIISRFLIPNDLRQIKLSTYVWRQMEKVTDIEGNIVECGIGRGRSFLYLASFVYLNNTNRKIWGFDSFEGFPEPNHIEKNTPRNPKKGEWAYMSASDIKNILKTSGIIESWISENIKLIPGFFDKTLDSYDGSQIALLHIDVDLYDSHLIVLNKFYKFVKKGGIIMFDDYEDPAWPGAKKAVDSFFYDKSEELIKDKQSGKYFVIKK